MDIPHSMDFAFNRREILKAIETVQSRPLTPVVSRNNMMPYA